MKILIIFSGSQGHYHGVKQFLDCLNLDEEIIYSSHIGMPEERRKKIAYIHINAPPAFLDYEFMHHKATKKIIQLKSDLVYNHRRKQALGILIDSVKPDRIILDNDSFTDALIIGELYRQSHMKIIFYQTKLSAALSRRSQYGGHKRNEMAFLPAKVILRRKKIHRWRKQLTMPGLNEDHRIRKFISSLNFHHVKLNRNRKGLNSLTYIPEIILSGKNLSFYHAENQFYTGLGLLQAPSRSEIGGKNKHILVSSGSRSHNYTDFGYFLDVIKHIMSQYSTYIFHLPQNLNGKISGDNISHYTWDTYHDHLAQSHLHITHGGINSIKDSLSYAIPMLICPLDCAKGIPSGEE